MQVRHINKGAKNGNHYKDLSCIIIFVDNLRSSRGLLIITVLFLELHYNFPPVRDFFKENIRYFGKHF